MERAFVEAMKHKKYMMRGDAAGARESRPMREQLCPSDV
jgi:hypothetical protein